MAEQLLRQPLRLDSNATLEYIPILLWELQIVEETKIRTCEFATEEAALPLQCSQLDVHFVRPGRTLRAGRGR
jgi:hypothetical protein